MVDSCVYDPVATAPGSEVEWPEARMRSIEAIMAISTALVDQCDAILIIGESAGVKRELDVIEAKGLPVYRSLKDVPAASSLPAS